MAQAAIAKSDLAAFLKTTPAQLDRLNPGLPDPIPADTLLTVPLDYITGEGETLDSVAERTGLAEAILRRANPTVGPQATLPAETRLLIPRLFVVYQPSAVAEIAEILQVAPETLLAFNPVWAGVDTIPADSVLVVPFK